MAQYIDKDALVAEIERLKTIYNDDENIHHIAKYNILVDILSFINTLEVKEVQEEPVDKCKGCNNVKGCITCVDGDQWAHYEEPASDDLLDTTQTITYNGEVYTRCYKDKLDSFACKYPMSVPKTSKRYAKYSDVDLTIAVKEGAKWQKTRDESITEDLGEYVNELSKQFPEVSFAKLSRIAVRVAKWKEQHMMSKSIDGRLYSTICGSEQNVVDYVGYSEYCKRLK